MLNLKQIALPSVQFWGLSVSLAALFLMGGSSRADVQSLAFLNPMLTICFGAALLTLKRKHLNDKMWLVILFASVFLMVIVHPIFLSTQSQFYDLGVLVPSSVIASTISASDTFAIWPVSASEAVIFLLGPCAVFLFAIQISADELKLTLPFIITVGAVSGVIGVLQLAGSLNGPLYFYDVTNFGSAVGLFANRNHAAVFLACIFPMLALLSAKAQITKAGRKNILQFTASTISVLLVPLILVTGSRSGLLTAGAGLIGSVLVYASHASLRTQTISRKSTIAATVIIFVSLIMVTVYFSRAESLERLFSDVEIMNDRQVFWSASLPLFSNFFPFGFGPGNFVPVFQVIEPIDMLGSVYLNRLHNDWLETGLAFGVPGIFLMLAAIFYFLRRSFILWLRMDGRRASVAMGRMASIVIAILAVASLSDYPLRTPAMAGFAALVLVWFAHAHRKPEQMAQHDGVFHTMRKGNSRH